MRNVVAWVFMYSIDGFLPNEGTPYWDYCFSVPYDAAHMERQLDLYASAHAHVMGRTAYEGMSKALPTSDHLFTPTMNAARKFVFSRTMTTAAWENTTIVSGDTAEEINKLRQGGEGHIMIWGGVRLWRSLMALDLLDEIHLDLYPYVAGEGMRLFDSDPAGYKLELVSSAPISHGRVALHYCRSR